MKNPHSGPRVLVIDDDSFVLEILNYQLNSLGCENVQGFSEAQQAMVLLETEHHGVELIFCDLDMPGIDGIEFVRFLGSLQFKGGLVLVSGEDIRVLQTAEKLAMAHQLRVLGALHKPISLSDLSAMLVLQGNLKVAVNPRAAAPPYSPEELRQGIANGELVNHYQPLVSLGNGEVVGMETLVRWQHPVDGLVFPDRFISLAEDHNLIDDLTYTVLSTALSQVREWNDQQIRLHISVNLSMNNLASLRFPDFVASTAAANDIPMSRLVLEVTESRLMKNRIASLDVLTRLRLKHVSLSIDDFGTGHSSLVQLRDVPFDQLKIDRSFVHGAWHDNSLRAIFEGSLGMARQLGMVSVAEGVEDENDWHFLRTTSCNLAQGYFIARPMVGEAVPDWMGQWQRQRRRLFGL